MKVIVDFDKIKDKKYLRALKIGALANEILRYIIETGVKNGTISRSQINTFRVKKESKTTFLISRPLLASNKFDVNNIARYYTTPILCYGENLYLFKDWDNKNIKQKENLINWIVEWINKNPIVIKPPTIIPEDEILILPKKKKGPKQRPITPPRPGRDKNGQLVYYNDNVGIDERVEGLCQKLELEYLEYIRHFARGIFHDILYEDFNIPRVELCKECPSEVWIHDDNYVTTKINDLIANGVSVNKSKIACILRHRSRIVGEFIHKPQPLIKIYFNQFDSTDWSGYFAKISQTLAHEYMHFLEYEYCRRFRAESNKGENVSEALADFFGVIYSLKRATDDFVITAKDRIEVAEKKYNEWVKWDGSGWPYAYALFFFIVDGERMPRLFANFDECRTFGSLDKLRAVFSATINTEDAYDKLKKL